VAEDQLKTGITNFRHIWLGGKLYTSPEMIAAIFEVGPMALAYFRALKR
jgi:hypothetical protein